MLKVNYKFIIFTILFFIYALLFGGNLPYTIFYTFLFAIILSIFYILNRRKTLLIDVDINKRIFSRGENSLFNINVYNNGNLPNCYTLIRSSILKKFDSSYMGSVITLRGNEDIDIKNNIVFKRRGIYDFGDVSWTIRDIFFIFKYTSHSNSDLKVKVYPKVHLIKGDFVIKNYIFQKTINNRTGYEDPFSARDVRKYNEGDSLRKIHWKISAKYNELYVKNVDNIMGQHCDLFMDMSENEFSTEECEEKEEKAVEFCASIINYMVDKGLKSTLYINNISSNEFAIEKEEDFIVVMDYFLENKSCGKRLFSNYIKTNSARLHNNNWIGIICSKINEGIMEELITLKEYGCDVNLFYEITENVQKNKIDKLTNLGIKCINIEEIKSQIYE